MREILFRGKRTDDGEWMCGSLTVWSDGSTSIDETQTDTSPLYSVIPETVGQYTGLTDRNGTKIFEGDIVQTEINCGNYKSFKFPVAVVVFENGSFCLKDTKNITPLTSYSSCVSFEVIGNVHDNLKLLKGEGYGTIY